MESNCRACQDKKSNGTLFLKLLGLGLGLAGLLYYLKKREEKK